MDPLTGGPGLYLATVWDQGRIKNLGTLGGGNSIAIAASDSNFVMGAAENGLIDQVLHFPVLPEKWVIRLITCQGGCSHDLAMIIDCA
jgi:hypothetical protein